MANIPIFSSLIKFGVTLATFSERMEKHEKRTDEIEKNYLHRFEEVKKDISDSKLEIVQKIDRMHIDIIDRINKK